VPRASEIVANLSPTKFRKRTTVLGGQRIATHEFIEIYDRGWYPCYFSILYSAAYHGTRGISYRSIRNPLL